MADLPDPVGITASVSRCSRRDLMERLVAKALAAKQVDVTRA
jgi:hypothetical protein